MKAKDIEVGHLYYVEFDPHEPGEFDRKHLAVVLKKNANNITFVTIPLTSNPTGLGVNKIPLGTLNCLPQSLQNKESYAVIDQVRTVSSSRFSNIMDNGQIFTAILPNDKMIFIFKAVIQDLLRDVPDADLRKILLS